jgi:DHA1 family multidrug resistance protein-like MFS transporter
VILCIPGALVDNYPGLMVLRFLIGLMASPPLATSGATLSDIWSPQDFPFAIGIWAATTSMGPAFGPSLSSYAVRELGWRFASWELLICAGPSFLLLFVSVPETSALTILHYHAKRLREATGDATIQSEAEAKQKHKKLSSILWDAGIKPWEMNIKDPALLFTTFYFALIYGIYYTFFEVSLSNSFRFEIVQLTWSASPCPWSSLSTMTSHPRVLGSSF